MMPPPTPTRRSFLPLGQFLSLSEIRPPIRLQSTTQVMFSRNLPKMSLRSGIQGTWYSFNFTILHTQTVCLHLLLLIDGFQCHWFIRETGGARSISVFDNDIGSGSVSPLIVTGGIGGDVGFHDFRNIATGKTKRLKHYDNSDGSSNESSNTNQQAGVINKVGHQNQNGMLWYIPKAHLGSVTKITTIANTSLFLTGSKDGDVKLWDAKAAELIYHWPKLHERRTFLQPSSRGFSRVVRPAVTDIQVLSHGFLTCGGNGCVKLILLQDYGT